MPDLHLFPLRQPQPHGADLRGGAGARSDSNCRRKHVRITYSLKLVATRIVPAIGDSSGGDVPPRAHGAGISIAGGMGDVPPAAPSQAGYVGSIIEEEMLATRRILLCVWHA